MNLDEQAKAEQQTHRLNDIGGIGGNRGGAVSDLHARPPSAHSSAPPAARFISICLLFRIFSNEFFQAKTLFLLRNGIQGF